MATVVDICNLALGNLGSASIESVDDGSIEAKYCSRYYPVARDALLEMHNWSFVNRASPTPPAVTEFSSIFVVTLSWYLASQLAGQLIKGKEGVASANKCLEQVVAHIELDRMPRIEMTRISGMVDYNPWKRG
ncbi:conserved hypothetical protein [Gammaproteobacteria bacterium]